MNLNRKKIAAACIAGAMLVSACPMNMRVYAGENLKTTGLNAGITAAITSYLDNTDAAKSVAAADKTKAAENKAESTEEVKETETEQTAAEETGKEAEPETICGYTNLGVANVESILNVREEPNETADLAGKMPANAGCEILEQSGDWYKIQSGKVTGYVKGEFLLTGEEAKTRAQENMSTIATVTTTTLFVRQEPNTDCEVIAMMPIEEELDVVEDQGDWIKVNVDEEEGYVSAEYVELSNQLQKAQSIQELEYGQGVSDTRVDLVSYACEFVGNPYVWGGTSLTNGADCSGFVLSIFAKYGIYLPHSSAAQAGYGTRVNASEAQPGDLFFYGSGSSISHVAIYIGNGQIVHASSAKTGIKISNAFYKTPICVTRLLG